MIDSIFFLPHGLQIIPGSETKYDEKFRSLHNEMLKIAEIISSRKIDQFILFTPHGYNLQNTLTIYQHEKFQGILYQLRENSVVYGDIKETYEFLSDIELNQEIYELLSDKISIEKITHGTTSYPITLNWGSFVPLYYTLNTIKKPTTIISFPRSRYDNLSELCKEVDKMVELLYGYLSEKDQRVSVLVSGDLSHVHQSEGPYGYHKSSEEFDNMVQNWMREFQEEYLQSLLDLQPKALACGMIGIYIIDKINKYVSLDLKHQYYDVPTYFGMGIGYWLPSN